jgi:hypothetical protein
VPRSQNRIASTRSDGRCPGQRLCGIGYSRNLGMRIDMIAAAKALAARVDTTWVDHTERATSPPSDHAALIADFHLRWSTVVTTTRTSIGGAEFRSQAAV